MNRRILTLGLAATLALPALAGEVEVGIGPFGVSVTPDGREVYVPLFGQYNPTWVDGTTCAILDARTGTALGSVEVGIRPEDVAFSADGGTAFVVNSTSADVTVIDVPTRTVISTVSVGSLWQTFPYGVVWVEAPKPAVFVTTTGGNYDGTEENIVVIDADPSSPSYLQVVDAISLTGGFTRPAWIERGKDLAVTRGFPGNDFSAAPSVVVFDLPSAEVAREVVISPVQGGVHGLEDLAVSRDGKFAYVAAFDWEFGSDEVFVVDIEEGRISDIVRLGTSDVAQHGIAMSPDGLLVPVTNFYSGTVSWIFTPTHTVVRETPSGAGANEVAFTPDGRRAFVTNQLAGTVSWFEVEPADALVTGLVREAIASGNATPAAAADLQRSLARLERALDRGEPAPSRAALADLVRRVGRHASAGEISIGLAKDLVPPAADENDVATPLSPGGVDVFDASASMLSR